MIYCLITTINNTFNIRNLEKNLDSRDSRIALIKLRLVGPPVKPIN